MRQNRFTEEQVEELIQWFRDHWKNMPESVVIDEATHVPDLRYTLPKLIDCVKVSWHKPFFDGYVDTLTKIKDAIEKGNN